MVNLIFIFFAFLFLSYNNYLLLNEEFLIFLCFITFIFLIYIKFSQNIKISLQNESKEIKQILQSSLNQSSKIYKKFLVLSSNFFKILKNFIFLKNYYLNFVLIFNNLLINFQKNKINLIYKKRLNLIHKIEQYTIKLLVIVIIKNLLKIIKIKKFYSTSLKVTYFLSFNKISLRENIYFILQKK